MTNECFRDRFFCNGEFKPSKDFDSRMLTEGTSIYEVMRIMNGIPIFVERHLQRLHNSAGYVCIDIEMKDNEIIKTIRNLVKENNVYFGNIKLVFNSLATYSIFSQTISEQINFLAYFVEHFYPTEQEYKDGVPTMFYYEKRKNPNAKVINVNLRKRTEHLIKEFEVYEVVLTGKKGYITEGSRSNIFFIDGDTVVTPPSEAVLPGIIRQTVIDICNNCNIKIKLKNISCTEIQKYESAFLTRTSSKVLPIARMEDTLFNVNNPILRCIMAEYEQILQNYLKCKINKL